MIRVMAAALIGVLISTPAWASGGACDALPGSSLGDVSIFWVIPFAGLLLSIAVVPMIAGHWWHHNKNQLITAAGWAAPVFGYLAYLYLTDSGRLGCEAGVGIQHALIEYVSFIALLGSLFIISGGILLKGDLQGKPIVNTMFLLVGAVIANVIGTTGASMLLIQPMLRTNSERKKTWHIPIFFIFLVSNIGGALTPIGDPPLFLGYLRGVDFFWTLTHLWWIWIPTVAVLLGMFYILDTIMYRKEGAKARKDDDEHVEPLGLEGSLNFLLLGGVIAAVLLLSPVNHAANSDDDHASISGPALDNGVLGSRPVQILSSVDPMTAASTGYAPTSTPAMKPSDSLDAPGQGWLGTPGQGWLSTQAMAAPDDGHSDEGHSDAEKGHSDQAHSDAAEHATPAGHDEHAADQTDTTDQEGEAGHAAAGHDATGHDAAGHDAAAGSHAAAAHGGGDGHGDGHGDAAHGDSSHAPAAWSLDPRDYFLREIVMALLAGLSLWVTSQRIRERNKFEYGPILEVAALFVGIFVAMVPATAMLQTHGGSLGLTEPWQFFWMTGGLSAFLDNAPTYVTFASVACGIDPSCTSASDLSPLMSGDSMAILMAISLGAVFMGAGSYIGNGPNFMVRAIAENYTMERRTVDEDGNEVVEVIHPYKMPSFFGYIGYAAVFLLPVFIVVSIVAFVLL